jgi:hypothetical protein
MFNRVLPCQSAGSAGTPVNNAWSLRRSLYGPSVPHHADSHGLSISPAIRTPPPLPTPINPTATAEGLTWTPSPGSLAQPKQRCPAAGRPWRDSTHPKSSEPSPHPQSWPSPPTPTSLSNPSVCPEPKRPCQERSSCRLNTAPLPYNLPVTPRIPSKPDPY